MISHVGQVRMHITNRNFTFRMNIKGSRSLIEAQTSVLNYSLVGERVLSKRVALTDLGLAKSQPEVDNGSSEQFLQLFNRNGRRLNQFCSQMWSGRLLRIVCFILPPLC